MAHVGQGGAHQRSARRSSATRSGIAVDSTVDGYSFGPLAAPGAGIAEIRALLEFYATAARGPVSGRGCLLCNTAVELGPRDPSGAGFVERYFERLSNAFHAALARTHREGVLRQSVDPRREADFFTASVLGLFVMLRAAAPPQIIERAAQVAIEHLEALRGDASTKP